MAKLCSQCNAQLEDGAVVCVHCGSAADEPAHSEPEQQPSPTRPFDIPNGEQPSSSQPIFSASANSMDNDLLGIGGWLILPAIGLAVSPFQFLHGVYTDLRIFSGDQYQNYLSQHRALAGLILFELLNNTILLVSTLYLNVLLYQKKKAFPTLMIIYLGAQLRLGLADHLMGARFNSSTDWTPLARGLVAAMVWIPYFLQSRRVKLTFVN